MDEALEKTLKKSAVSVLKKIPSIAFLIVFCLLACFTFAFSIGFWKDAQATGGMFGGTTGKLIGRAVGSIEGITIGREEGYKAGKEEAQRVKDITADLSNRIQEVKRLEVLVASGTFSDVLSIGEGKLDYAALLSMKYNAVFTIDLGKAEVELVKGEGLHITLDPPSVEFIPIGAIEMKNEYQRPDFIIKPGSAEDGYIAAHNSMNAMKDKAQEAFANNKGMMQAARTSAVTQLKQLVHAVSVNKHEVFVHFRGGAQNV